ncbi:MAG: rod shape-determining protein MreC [Rhodobacterales bacterium TMED271]|nr:MAG: rod shape-determining protein MreC [Rhodobacterales bacterium TMED271]
MASKSKHHRSKSWSFTITVMVFICLAAIFILWRVDNTRTELVRTKIIDFVSPITKPLNYPIKVVGEFIKYFEVYSSLLEENKDLKRALQNMAVWKEKALQLEQKNAQLRALNNVKLSADLTWVTGEIMADSGSPFYQSGIVNIGLKDGIKNGSAAVDGLGLVGRISGVGQNVARVLFLTDISSAIPVKIKRNNQKGILIGDNSPYPVLEFVEEKALLNIGDRVFTSGDGNVFPSDILIGNILVDERKKLRVKPIANFESLEFLRVLNARKISTDWEESELVGMEPF